MSGPDVLPTALRTVEDPPEKDPKRYPAIAVYTGLRQVVDGGATFHILLCISSERDNDQPQPFFVRDRGPRSVVEATSIRCGECRKRHPLMGIVEALELWGGGKEGGYNIEFTFDGGLDGFCLNLRFLVSNWIRGLETHAKGGNQDAQAKP